MRKLKHGEVKLPARIQAQARRPESVPLTSHCTIPQVIIISLVHRQCAGHCDTHEILTITLT